MKVLSILTNEKHFPKTISLIYIACLQNYRELLSLATFLGVHSDSKEVSYLSWQNTCPNLETICHIKPKFFLWTKLLENLLHVKYLISVAAPLSNLSRNSHFVRDELFNCSAENFVSSLIKMRVVLNTSL